MSKWKKPNWYPEDQIIPTEKGWVHTNGSGEVLEAIGGLTDKVGSGVSTLVPVKFKESSYLITQRNANKQRLDLVSRVVRTKLEQYNTWTTNPNSGLEDQGLAFELFSLRNSDFSIDDGVFKTSIPGIASVIAYEENNKSNNSATLIVSPGLRIDLPIHTGLDSEVLDVPRNIISPLSSGYVLAQRIPEPTEEERKELKSIKVFDENGKDFEDFNYIKKSGLSSYLSRLVNSYEEYELTSSDDSILKMGSRGETNLYETYNKPGKVTVTVKSLVDNGITKVDIEVIDYPFPFNATAKLSWGGMLQVGKLYSDSVKVNTPLSLGVYPNIWGNEEVDNHFVMTITQADDKGKDIVTPIKYGDVYTPKYTTPMRYKIYPTKNPKLTFDATMEVVE